MHGMDGYTSKLLMLPQVNRVREVGKWGQGGSLLYFYLFTPEFFELLQRTSITCKKNFFSCWKCICFAQTDLFKFAQWPVWPIQGLEGLGFRKVVTLTPRYSLRFRLGLNKAVKIQIFKYLKYLPLSLYLAWSKRGAFAPNCILDLPGVTEGREQRQKQQNTSLPHPRTN